MARIQSKTSGDRPKRVRIKPIEIRAKCEETLVKLGKPSQKWGDQRFGGDSERRTRAPGP